MKVYFSLEVDLFFLKKKSVTKLGITSQLYPKLFCIFLAKKFETANNLLELPKIFSIYFFFKKFKFGLR